MAPSVLRLLQYFLVDRAIQKDDAWAILASNKVTLAKASETIARSWLEAMYPLELDRPEEHLLQDAISLAADQIADRLNLRRSNYRGGRAYQESRPTTARNTKTQPIVLQFTQPAQTSTGTALPTTVPTLSSDPQVAALLSALQAQVTQQNSQKKTPNSKKRQRK